MRAFSPKLAGLVATLFLAAFAAACSGIPQDGRYQTNSRGGWDNFRAAAPTAEPWRASIV